MQAVSSALYKYPAAAAVLNVMGAGASLVGAEPPQTATETFDGLWPTGSPSCVNTWSGTPCPGWAPGITPEELPNPLDAQACACTVQEVIAYKNALYASDVWGTDGYEGYSEYLGAVYQGSGMAEASWTYN